MLNVCLLVSDKHFQIYFFAALQNIIFELNKNQAIWKGIPAFLT